VCVCVCVCVWVCVVSELSLIAKNLSNIHSILDISRAEAWQRHQQIHGSTGGVNVKGRDL